MKIIVNNWTDAWITDFNLFFIITNLRSKHQIDVLSAWKNNCKKINSQDVPDDSFGGQFQGMQKHIKGTAGVFAFTWQFYKHLQAMKSPKKINCIYFSLHHTVGKHKFPLTIDNPKCSTTCGQKLHTCKRILMLKLGAKQKNSSDQITAFLPRSLQASEQSSAEWLYNVFARRTSICSMTLSRSPSAFSRPKKSKLPRSRSSLSISPLKNAEAACFSP